MLCGFLQDYSNNYASPYHLLPVFLLFHHNVRLLQLRLQGVMTHHPPVCQYRIFESNQGSCRLLAKWLPSFHNPLELVYQRKPEICPGLPRVVHPHLYKFHEMIEMFLYYSVQSLITLYRYQYDVRRVLVFHVVLSQDTNPYQNHHELTWYLLVIM